MSNNPAWIPGNAITGNSTLGDAPTTGDTERRLTDLENAVTDLATLIANRDQPVAPGDISSELHMAHHAKLDASWGNDGCVDFIPTDDK